jgi:hypothetical protein
MSGVVAYHSLTGRPIDAELADEVLGLGTPPATVGLAGSTSRVFIPCGRQRDSL